MSDLVPVNRREVVANTLLALRQEGLLEYGKFIPREKIMELLGKFSNEKNLWSSMIEIANQLLQEGKVISSAHLNGSGWRILREVENYHATIHWHDGISRSYRKSITLLANTNRSSMNEAEKLRDTNWQRQLEHEYLMFRRRSEAMEVIRKHRPGILKKDRTIEIS